MDSSRRCRDHGPSGKSPTHDRRPELLEDSERPSASGVWMIHASPLLPPAPVLPNPHHCADGDSWVSAAGFDGGTQRKHPEIASHQAVQQTEHNPESSKRCSQSHQRKPQDTDGDGHAVLRKGKRCDPRKGDDNDHHRGCDLRLDCRLSDYERSDNADGGTDRPRQTYAGFPEQFKWLP